MSLPPASVRPESGITWSDLALAAVIAALTVFGSADAADGTDITSEAYALMVLAGMTLVVRRAAPMTTWAAATTIMFVYFLRGHPEGMVWLPSAVGIAGVAIAYGWRRGAALVVVSLLLANVHVLLGQEPAAPILSPENLSILLGLGGTVAVGEWIRNRRAYLSIAEDRAALAEASRQHEAERRVGEERLRIAREVHDVVAHVLASIHVQAGVGEHLGRTDHERSQEILGSIRAASQEALDDLRATLGGLRSGVAGGAGLGAAPTLADVDRLLTMAREAGLDATLEVEGVPTGLTPAVELAAYRIVQESVTNAIKHAGDARLAVVIRHRPATTEVEVVDDGTAAEAEAPTDVDEPGGLGLRGMRERTEMLGGAFEAGRLPSGGFRVFARLPTGAGS